MYYSIAVENYKLTLLLLIILYCSIMYSKTLRDYVNKYLQYNICIPLYITIIASCCKGRQSNY